VAQTTAPHTSRDRDATLALPTLALPTTTVYMNDVFYPGDAVDLAVERGGDRRRLSKGAVGGSGL
jgi:hypothetical protein